MPENRLKNKKLLKISRVLIAVIFAVLIGYYLSGTGFRVLKPWTTVRLTALRLFVLA